MSQAWKDWIGVGSGTRRSIVLAAIAYMLLAAVSIVFFVQLQGAETRMRDFLARDDRSMFSRTSLEYERAIQTLLRASNAPVPIQVAAVRQPIDILYNRLNVFLARSDATRFVDGLPEFEAFVSALDRALKATDGIFQQQAGPTLSRAADIQLIAILDSVRPQLESAIAEVIATSAAQRDALQRDLDQVRALMLASMVAFAVGSLLFVGYLARGNRQIARQNRELKAATWKLAQSEARLHAFMQNAPAVMAILDRDRRFEIVNPRAERFYGRMKVDLVGRRGLEIRDLAGEAELEALKQAVIETGTARHGQYRHVTPFGEVWKFNVAFPIHDTANALEAIGVIGMDITELKNAEAETTRQRERAERASDAKSRMLANASHELRTPLNAIIGFGQVIEAEMFGMVGVPAYKDYAGNIVESGRHLVAVIDTMLDLSRLETGQSDLVPTRVSPNDILSSAATIVQSAAARAGLALTVSRDATLPDLLVDRGKITQVLVNLLSNAVKFTNPGGRIVVRCTADRESLSFVVTDTGIGIEEADLSQVVLPFTRGGSALVRSQEGTGLGLAIAKALVEQHDGALILESQPGAGTTVTVRLPATRLARRLPQTRIA